MALWRSAVRSRYGPLPMFKKIFFILTLSLLCQNIGTSQFKIISKKIIAQIDSVEFGYPIFSNSGSEVYFTTLDYNDIWKVNINNGELSKIVSGELLGYGFSISDNDKFIAYRKTTWTGNNRLQENFVKEISTEKNHLLIFGEEVLLPKFELIDANSKKLIGINQTKSAKIVLQGIVDEKINLVLDGNTKILDPIENGKYIWPELSPDKKFIVAYELTEGLIISDLNGKILKKLGYYDSPSWTKDGKWIVCHKEEDSDNSIESSELYALSINGNQKIQLTNSSEIELYPSASKSKNQIACHTKDGKVILFEYSIDE